MQELLSSPEQSTESYLQQHSLASTTTSPSPACAHLQHPVPAAVPATTPARSAGQAATNSRGCSASGSNSSEKHKALASFFSTSTATPKGSPGGAPVTSSQAPAARRSTQQQSTLAADWQSHYQFKAGRCPSPAGCSTLAPAAQHVLSRCASPSYSLQDNRVASSSNAPTSSTDGSTWLPPPAGEPIQSS